MDIVNWCCIRFKGSGEGMTLEGVEGLMIEQSLRFEFKANKNQA